MNFIKTLSICRKTLFSGLMITLLALPLSGCLKVTGPAKDGFDLENEEPKLNLSGLFSKKKISDEHEKPGARTAQLEKTERTGGANLSTPTDERRDGIDNDLSSEAANETSGFQPELPEQDFPTLSPQEIADFDSWKKARSEDSSQYREFREYLEFKEYQKWLKLQNESKPN